MAGSGAVPEARNLREYEPHPMCAFSAGAKFIDDLLVDRLLRDDEPLESLACLLPRHVGFTWLLTLTAVIS